MSNKNKKSKKRIEHQLFEIYSLVNDRKVAKALLRELSLEEMGEILQDEYEKFIANGKGRSIRPDIYLVTEGGIVTLDLQNDPESDFTERLAHYGVTLSSKLLKAGEDYHKLSGRRVVIVFICDFDLEKKGEAIYTISAGEDLLHILGWDLFLFVIVNKPLVVQGDDYLAKLLRDYDKKEGEEYETLEFKEARDAIEANGEGDDKVARGYSAIRKEAEARARQEGHVEGRAEGIAEGKVDVAKNMITEGDLSDERISRLTSIPLEEVAKLRLSFA